MKFHKKTLKPLAFIIGLVILVIVFFPDITRPENKQYLAIFGVILLLLLVDIFFSQRKTTNDKLEFPYLLRDDFLSPAEQSFYLVLKHTVSDWALICPKVNLFDLFYVKYSNQKRFWKYMEKINRKHVDFLLCDPKTAKPLLGIELDDKSHERSDRKVRDELVDNVFSAANLPLARIPVKHSYSTSELESLLRQHIASNMDNTPNQAVTIENENTPPHCPKCGSKMVLRKAKTGSNQGEQFWGCPNFPRCRSILKIEWTHCPLFFFQAKNSRKSLYSIAI